MSETTINYTLPEKPICGTCFSRCHTTVEQTYLIVGTDGILTETQATCSECNCEECRS